MVQPTSRTGHYQAITTSDTIIQVVESMTVRSIVASFVEEEIPFQVSRQHVVPATLATWSSGSRNGNPFRHTIIMPTQVRQCSQNALAAPSCSSFDKLLDRLQCGGCRLLLGDRGATQHSKCSDSAAPPHSSLRASFPAGLPKSSAARDRCPIPSHISRGSQVQGPAV